MYEAGEKAGLTHDVLEYFKYACYEVKVELDVDDKTGSAKIIKVEDRKVENA